MCRYARTHRHLAIKLSVSDPLTENGSWMFCMELIRCTRPQNYMRGDMVAGTFNAYTVKDGVMQKHLHFTGWKETAARLACTIAALAIGMAFPLVAGKDTWSYLTFAYIFMAAVMPMWLTRHCSRH